MTKTVMICLTIYIMTFVNFAFAVLFLDDHLDLPRWYGR